MTMKDTERIKAAAVIPAAGLGRRMGRGEKKTYMELAGRPALFHTLAAFESCPAVASVVVVVSPGDEALCREEVVERFGLGKVSKVVPGGAERQDSVARGVEAAGPGWDVIAVHDGARPLVTPEIIEKTVAAAHAHRAAVSAVRVKDTIKEADGDVVARTLPRERLWAVHTPQAFQAGLLMEAHRRAAADGFLGTDESSLVERLGVGVRLVEGSYENIKITTPGDVPVAELILAGRTSGHKTKG